VRERTRYALVGAGARGIEMFADPIAGRFADVAELVGVYDVNPIRARAVARRAGATAFDTFDDLLRGSRPDVVIVASVDATHHRYIVQALQADCDVVTEKPMTVGADQVREILEARRATGRDVRVAFNYRYTPVFTQVKQILAAGEIGTVRSLDFHWYLDTQHGADYFRRWHRRMERSGGLFVHKATHHFDLVNWWLDDRPAAVLAAGRLAFYGPAREAHGTRCLTCDHRGTCEFAWDLRADDDLRRLYLDAESADGYHRDGCVFDPEIDIYDTMSAIVRYSGGAQMTYSLAAYAAYEGMRVAFNGELGRLELDRIESRPAEADEILLYRFLTTAPASVVRVPRTEEGHGGADERLQDELFRGASADPSGRAADQTDGAYSVLTGVAANASVLTGAWVSIEGLLQPTGEGAA
jgi:predicted dehydrogenase